MDKASAFRVRLRIGILQHDEPVIHRQIIMLHASCLYVQETENVENK